MDIDEISTLPDYTVIEVINAKIPTMTDVLVRVENYWHPIGWETYEYSNEELVRHHSSYKILARPV